MMRSLFSGVSGLKGHQTRMDVIGNNIANVNATGFKSSRVTFADTLSQTQTGASAPGDTIGGTNPKQIGLGTGVASIDLLFTDGSVQSTGKNTDLCLSGNGLFVVKSGNDTYYTRDGAFEFDAEGNYVLPGNGMKVQGWMASKGTLSTSAAATDIQIAAGKSMEASATKTVTYKNNLDASTLLIKSITYTNADGTTGTGNVTVDGETVISAVLTLTDDSTVTVTSGHYELDKSIPVTTNITIYDSLGAKHDVPVLFVKTGANTWEVTLKDGKTSVTIDEDDGSTTTVTLTPGAPIFTSKGAYDKDSSTNGSLAIKYTNGAADQTVTLDYTNLTQFAGNSTINPTNDGNAAGVLKSVSVDSSGIITGTYTNGVRQAEAQVAVAQFTNASGLTKTGSSLYQESNNSGTANVKTATDLGVTITPSALEMSNVDIANEFSDMIITQRGFQSNSKVITVGDEMLETLINMKR